MTHKAVKAQPTHAAATFSAPIGFHRQLDAIECCLCVVWICASKDTHTHTHTHTSLHLFSCLTDFHEIWHEYYVIKSYLNAVILFFIFIWFVIPAVSL